MTCDVDGHTHGTTGDRRSFGIISAIDDDDIEYFRAKLARTGSERTRKQLELLLEAKSFTTQIQSERGPFFTIPAHTIVRIPNPGWNRDEPDTQFSMLVQIHKDIVVTTASPWDTLRGVFVGLNERPEGDLTGSYLRDKMTDALSAAAKDLAASLKRASWLTTIGIGADALYVFYRPGMIDHRTFTADTFMGWPVRYAPMDKIAD